jgi:hypothetical protein
MLAAAAAAARRGAVIAQRSARRLSADAAPAADAADAADAAAKDAFMAKAGKSLKDAGAKFASLEEVLTSKRLALKKAGLPVKEVRGGVAARARAA